MEISDADIQNLRAAFFKKVEESGFTEGDAFHIADMNKIKANGDWLRRFLLHHDNDQKEALNMLWETCDWRKKFGTNEISEKNVNMAILELGSVFAHNRDKDGKALLIFKSKKHVKGTYSFEELQRCLVYWLERLERQENGEMITIFFDMDGAGVSNMDMEYTKYIIGLFKSYYPHFLNYILIFEMAWVLNAAFKIIKSWLPPKAVQKIKSLSKSNVKEYVDFDNALKSWGGKDDFVFEFSSEVRTAVAEVERKKVHFADRSPVLDTSTDSFLPSTPSKLEIKPRDVVTFQQDGSELTASILLRNGDVSTISYKIKTTAPVKFRVRPSAGMLAPGNQDVVTVNVLPGYSGEYRREKFLIMSVPVPNPDNVDLNELWKTAGKDVVQQRLRCSNPQSTTSDAVNNGVVPDGDRQITKLSTEISKLNHHLTTVAQEVRRIQIQQWVLILLVGILAILTLYFGRENKIDKINGGSCFAPPTPQP